MNRFNRGMHAAAADALGLSRSDRVLEVGFGGATLLEELFRRVPEGSVTGLELSETMLRGARHRLRREIEGLLRGAGFDGVVSRRHGQGRNAFVLTETGTPRAPSDGMR